MQRCSWQQQQQLLLQGRREEGGGKNEGVKEDGKGRGALFRQAATPSSPCLMLLAKVSRGGARGRGPWRWLCHCGECLC